MKVPALSSLILAVFVAHPSIAAPFDVTLYDVDLGTTPESQGWTYFADLGGITRLTGIPPLDITVTTGGRYVFNTTNAALQPMAGMPQLDVTDPFSLEVDLRLSNSGTTAANVGKVEIHVIDRNKQGFVLGFHADRVFGRRPDGNGGQLAGEIATGFDTTAAMVRYRVDVSASGYAVFADGAPLLTGSVRSMTGLTNVSNGSSFWPTNTIGFGAPSVLSGSSAEWGDIRLFNNEPPTADADTSAGPGLGAYAFSAGTFNLTLRGASDDPNGAGTIASRTWSTQGNPNLASGDTPSVSLAQSGLTKTTDALTLTYTVTDGEAVPAQDTAGLSYSNVAPTVTTPVASLDAAGLTAAASFDDADLAANNVAAGGVAGFESVSAALTVNGIATPLDSATTGANDLAGSSLSGGLSLQQLIQGGHLTSPDGSLTVAASATDFAGLAADTQGSTFVVTYDNAETLAVALPHSTDDQAKTVTIGFVLSDGDFLGNQWAAGRDFQQVHWQLFQDGVALTGIETAGTAADFDPLDPTATSRTVSLTLAASLFEFGPDGLADIELRFWDAGLGASLPLAFQSLAIEGLQEPVPAPAAALLLSLGGLAALRRRG